MTPTTEDGLVTVQSPVSVRETIDRIESFAAAHGLISFARVDHAAGAAKVGMTLRPTELILFGHPKAGTPLMQERQTAGIDLPLKALAWEDSGGKVWLSYNDAAWIGRRHQLGSASVAALNAISAGLAAVVKAATALENRCAARLRDSTPT